ncbi:MAG TPA: hypothetical protein VN861_14650 [Candidatus Acidoferrales bacterium]|jgi:hypothetical protein|nr:hypothetical protein [Candidatus Acidoferrales bacterium]
MRVHKKVLSRDTGHWILCSFDDCENPGYELYKAVVHDGYEPILIQGQVTYAAKLINYVFCCEGHKQLWVDSAGPEGFQGKYRSGNKSMARLL